MISGEAGSLTEDFVDDILEHHGVKGMKWGVHNDGEVSSTTEKTGKLARKSTHVTVMQRPGRAVKATGGRRNIASNDAVKAAAAKQFAKKSTTDSLSTKQLQEVVQRMNLEQQYSKLVKKSKRQSAATDFVAKLVGNKDTQHKVIKTAKTTVKVAGLLAL